MVEGKVNVEEELEARGREKHPYSKRKDNPDGMTERQMELLSRGERGLSRKYKKRHRKELPASIRAEIVRLYNEEHLL